MDTAENNQEILLKRIDVSEKIINGLENGKFLHLLKLLGNARFDSYEITDLDAFQDDCERPDVKKFLDAAEFRGTVHVSLEPLPRVRLFTARDLSESSALLLSNSQQRIAALTYSALGLDMSGLGSLITDRL